MGFRINRVYTRSGDKGETSLIDGSRVPKNHPRCVAFGGFDEISCHLGLAKDSLGKKDSLILVREVLEFLQQELFDLGAELATPNGYEYPGMWKVSMQSVAQLESLCDHFNVDIPELNSFILPGGSVAVGHIHLARAVTRRVERDLVAYLISEPQAITNETMQYCNRLSDLLFILCRYVLHVEGLPEPLWVKAKGYRVFSLPSKK